MSLNLRHLEPHERPSYYHIRDDGASARCQECEQDASCSDVYYVVTPDGTRGTFHKTCLDEAWLKIATDEGYIGEENS